jgi:hypothetical protein
MELVEQTQTLLHLRQPSTLLWAMLVGCSGMILLPGSWLLIRELRNKNHPNRLGSALYLLFLMGAMCGALWGAAAYFFLLEEGFLDRERQELRRVNLNIFGSRRSEERISVAGVRKVQIERFSSFSSDGSELILYRIVLVRPDGRLLPLLNAGTADEVQAQWLASTVREFLNLPEAPLMLDEAPSQP